MKRHLTECVLLLLFAISFVSCKKEEGKGQVVLYTHNQALLNCGDFEVEILLGDEIMGTIEKPLLPFDFVPDCVTNDESAVLNLKLPEGKYQFVAIGHCGPDLWDTVIIPVVHNECSVVEVLQIDQSKNPLSGCWEVAYYEDLEQESVTTKDDFDPWEYSINDVQIMFLDDSTFCGINTTNDIAGHYTIADSIFDIDVYGGTKVGQPDWGNMFSDVVLSHSFTYFKRINNELKLFYNDNKNCVVLFPLDDEIICRFTYSND